MAYDQKHLYLTVHWADTREPNEGGQFGIRFNATQRDGSQALVDATKAPLTTFWLSAGALIPAWYTLKFARLATIDPDGHYTPGTFSYDVQMDAATQTANINGVMPLQVASVVTLLTDRPRGQASHGRVYLPPLAATLGSNGRWTAAQVDARATAFATCLTALNSALTPANGLASWAAVFSQGTKKGAPPIQAPVTGIKIGTRADVQRRRAKSMAEVYGATKTVTHP